MAFKFEFYFYDNEIFDLYACYQNDSLTLHMNFTVNKNFSIDEFLNGECSLMGESGEVNGSNWDLKLNSNGFFQYTLESNVGSTYLTKTFKRDDPFILQLVEKLKQGCEQASKRTSKQASEQANKFLI